MTPELSEAVYRDGKLVPQFLRPSEVAEWLCISQDTVYLAIKNGDLYCRKFSARQFRIPREAVIAWMYKDPQ